MTTYDTWPGFENVYLEDSFVLDVDCTMNTYTFHLWLVLREAHVEYVEPKSNEMYCYKRARIVFENCTYILFEKLMKAPFYDKSGDIDYGNIDTALLDGDVFKLEGDWGRVELRSSMPIIIMQ